DEVAFMGDDLPDLRVMLQVGLSAAPASAHPWVRERVRWRTSASAGLGAVREFCDLLLAAQGRVEALLDEVRRVEGMRVEGTACAGGRSCRPACWSLHWPVAGRCGRTAKSRSSGPSPPVAARTTCFTTSKWSRWMRTAASRSPCARP